MYTHIHRHVRLPAAFPSLEAYAQGMGRALTEELNLMLAETVNGVCSSCLLPPFLSLSAEFVCVPSL